MKKYIQEWLLTFSDKASRYSSKRIERFAVFSVMLSASAFWLFKGITKCSVNATDLMIVVVGWLGYAGFNTIQGKKDIDKEKNEEQSA